MKKNEDRLLPQNLQAEMALLSNQIAFEEIIDSVRQIVSPDDFYNDIFGSIQRTLISMRDNREPIDFVTVAEKLMAKGVFADFGGNHLMVELATGAPSRMADTDYANRHAELVADKSRRRKAIREAERLSDEAWNEASDVTEIWQSIADAADSSLGRIKTENGPKSIKDHALAVARKHAEGLKPTKYIGIDSIDDAIKGVAGGENIVIAGLTSHGKTMLTMQWLHEASRRGIPSMIISKEMNGESLASRVIPGITELVESNGDWQLSNDILVADIERHYANRAPIMVFDGCNNGTELERAIDRGVREYGVGLVALDYLQLVNGVGLTREQQVADVSRRWKQSLMKHDIPGLLLSQLNREASKLNRRPQLSDLKDSGSVEQDADIVLFPYWEAKTPNSKADPFLYRIYIEKSRQRGTRVPVVEMRVDPAKQWLFPAETQDTTSYLADNW